MGQRTVSLDSETQLLLNRVGWRRASKRSLYAACQIGVPLGLVTVVVLAQMLFFKEVSQPLVAPMFALCIG